MKYCTIEHSKKPHALGSGYLDLLGGGIFCYNSFEAEPSFPVPSSPTIDHCLIANNHALSGGGAGNPKTPIGLEPSPNGGIINMGAYGGTVEASQSPSVSTP